MFQNKNNQTTDGGQTNLSQEHDLPIEDLPVHTMKKDLETLKNPELAKAESEYQESASHPRPVNRETLTEAQKSSPFLNFSAPKNAGSRPEIVRPAISDSRIKLVEPAPKPEKPAFDSEKKSPQPEQHPHHINFSKVFAGVITVLIIAIIAGGGYYFWITRQSAPEIVVAPPVIEPEPMPEPEPVAKFSTDKPNYLTIDITTATGAAIKEVLQNTAKDVSDEKVVSPVEFIITGADEKPVIFKDFTRILGVTFSPALAANLSDTFSLFVYNDINVTRLGLTLNFKEQKDLINMSRMQIKPKDLLLMEEANLAKELSPLFLAAEYTLPAKTFATGDYNGLAIRYMNIISPENLSVDYAIYNNKLVIGTTKLTLRSIVDYLKPELE